MRARGRDARLTPVTNLALDPQATVNGRTWTTSRWFGGSGATGTHSMMTGPTPVGSTFIRKVWSVGAASSNGDTGFETRKQGFAVRPGMTLTFSGFLRPSTAQRGRMSVYFYDAAASTALQRLSPEGSISLPAGQWTRQSMTATAPAGSAWAQVAVDIYVGGTLWTPGDTLDGTGLMATEGSTLHPYADGTSPGWRWNGSAHNSESVGYPKLTRI